MYHAKLIICEKTNRWATWLRPWLADTGICLLETRALSGALNCLRQQPASALAVEVNRSNLVRVLETIREARQLASACIVALAERRLREHQWIMRGFGADYVAFSPIELPTVAKLVRRSAANEPRTDQDVSMTERMRQRLPWQR